MTIFKKLSSLYFTCSEIQNLINEIKEIKLIPNSPEIIKKQNYLKDLYRAKLFELENNLKDIESTPIELSYFVAFGQIVKDKGIKYSTLLNIYNFPTVLNDFSKL